MWATRMIGVDTTSIGELGAPSHTHWAHHFRFVDRDMVMRFHFGLGVGHVYSHHRPTQPELQPEGSVTHATLTHDDEDLVETDEVENQEDSEDDDEDSSTRGGSDVEQWFSSSNESLLDQFNEMYDSEVSLDYEN